MLAVVAAEHTCRRSEEVQNSVFEQPGLAVGPSPPQPEKQVAQLQGASRQRGSAGFKAPRPLGGRQRAGLQRAGAPGLARPLRSFLTGDTPQTAAFGEFPLPEAGAAPPAGVFSFASGRQVTLSSAAQQRAADVLKDEGVGGMGLLADNVRPPELPEQAEQVQGQPPQSAPCAEHEEQPLDPSQSELQSCGGGGEGRSGQLLVARAALPEQESPEQADEPQPGDGGIPMPSWGDTQAWLAHPAVQQLLGSGGGGGPPLGGDPAQPGAGAPDPAPGPGPQPAATGARAPAEPASPAPVAERLGPVDVEMQPGPHQQQPAPGCSGAGSEEGALHATGQAAADEAAIHGSLTGCSPAGPPGSEGGQLHRADGAANRVSVAGAANDQAAMNGQSPRCDSRHASAGRPAAEPGHACASSSNGGLERRAGEMEEVPQTQLQEQEQPDDIRLLPQDPCELGSVVLDTLLVHGRLPGEEEQQEQEQQPQVEGVSLLPQDPCELGSMVLDTLLAHGASPGEQQQVFDAISRPPQELRKLSSMVLDTLLAHGAFPGEQQQQHQVEAVSPPPQEAREPGSMVLDTLLVAHSALPREEQSEAVSPPPQEPRELGSMVLDTLLVQGACPGEQQQQQVEAVSQPPQEPCTPGSMVLDTLLVDGALPGDQQQQVEHVSRPSQEPRELSSMVLDTLLMQGALPGEQQQMLEATGPPPQEPHELSSMVLDTLLAHGALPGKQQQVVDAISPPPHEPREEVSMGLDTLLVHGAMPAEQRQQHHMEAVSPPPQEPVKHGLDTLLVHGASPGEQQHVNGIRPPPPPPREHGSVVLDTLLVQGGSAGKPCPEAALILPDVPGAPLAESLTAPHDAGWAVPQATDRQQAPAPWATASGKPISLSKEQLAAARLVLGDGVAVEASEAPGQGRPQEQAGAQELLEDGAAGGPLENVRGAVNADAAPPQPDHGDLSTSGEAPAGGAALPEATAWATGAGRAVEVSAEKLAAARAQLEAPGSSTGAVGTLARPAAPTSTIGSAPAERVEASHAVECAGGASPRVKRARVGAGDENDPATPNLAGRALLPHTLDPVCTTFTCQKTVPRFTSSLTRCESGCAWCHYWYLLVQFNVSQVSLGDASSALATHSIGCAPIAVQQDFSSNTKCL